MKSMVHYIWLEDFLSGFHASDTIRLCDGLSRLISELRDMPATISPETFRYSLHQWPGILIAYTTARVDFDPSRRDPDQFLGMGQIAIYNRLDRKSATIQDVVVDQTVRGEGIGREIMHRLIQEAVRQRVSTIELTSHLGRKDEIRLYESLGFKRRETNCYRLDLQKALFTST